MESKDQMLHTRPQQMLVTPTRFVLIDGDNIPDDKFFNLTLNLQERDKDCVFRWRAKNHINGLMYGNGGLSCWTKDFVYNMKTHEASDGALTNDVEFCFYPNYIAMYDCYSAQPTPTLHRSRPGEPASVKA
jgi:hypothetical protein